MSLPAQLPPQKPSYRARLSTASFHPSPPAYWDLSIINLNCNQCIQSTGPRDLLWVKWNRDDFSAAPHSLKAAPWRARSTEQPYSKAKFLFSHIMICSSLSHSPQQSEASKGAGEKWPDIRTEMGFTQAQRPWCS